MLHPSQPGIAIFSYTITQNPTRVQEIIFLHIVGRS